MQSSQCGSFDSGWLAEPASASDLYISPTKNKNSKTAKVCLLAASECETLEVPSDFCPKELGYDLRLLLSLGVENQTVISLNRVPFDTDNVLGGSWVVISGV